MGCFDFIAYDETERIIISSLTNLEKLIHFGFLTFSGGIEMWHWTKMG